ncbi:MAG: hypothetical protein E5299_00517 [Burkholderia gladioli]|nr:MAG: hypothetical protein E5299_00517 [Burkholderia gladioli]
MYPLSNERHLRVVKSGVEQLGQSVTVSHIPIHHNQRGMHLTCMRIDREIDFTPPRAPASSSRAGVHLLFFTFVLDPQNGAVDHQVDRFAVAKDRQFDIKRFAQRQSVV